MRWLWIILTALLIIGLGPLAFGQDPSTGSGQAYSTRPEWRRSSRNPGRRWTRGPRRAPCIYPFLATTHHAPVIEMGFT